MLATAVALVLVVVDRRQDVAPAQPVPRLVLRRVAIARIAASALALAGDDDAAVARAHANEVNLSATQTMARQVMGVTPVPASPHIRALQIDAWRRMGGNWLTQHLTNDWTQYLAALRVAIQPGHNTWTQAQSQFSSVCADFARLARIASGYFDVPEPIAQSHWQTAITLANRGSQHCQQALTRQNSQLFRQATLELRSAATESTATSDRAEAVQHVGGP